MALSQNIAVALPSQEDPLLLTLCRDLPNISGEEKRVYR